MRRLVRNQKGQFVIIAAMLVALMMISLSPLLHEAATYYTHEPWEEYLSLIGGLELNSQRLTELSLVNYSQTGNQSILGGYLNQWQVDLSQIYPGRGMLLAYNLKNGTVGLHGTNIDYTSGLCRYWNQKSSYSSAKVQYGLDMASVGLTGYRYEVTVHLNLTILQVDTSNKQINVTVGQEEGLPVDNLGKNNFNVTSGSTSISITSVTQTYDPSNTLIYVIECGQSFSKPVDVIVVDQRGIVVVSRFS